MIEKVKNYIKLNKMYSPGDKVFLGVSGGADSICLLTVLHKLREELGIKLVVLHVNHGIRGEEAKRDEDFVNNYCQKLGVELRVLNANVPAIAKEKGLSEEEAGRIVRYDYFAKEANGEKVAVAHNLNDSSETVLFNLFRGTGIKGLTGISPVRDMVTRPLLCVTRKEIEEFLENNGIEYCDDSTNSSVDYSRNKIRLKVLPFVNEEINDRALENIVGAADNLNEIYDFLKYESKKAYDLYVRDGVLLNEARALHKAVLTEVIRMWFEANVGRLKDVTKTHINMIAEMLEMPVSKQISLPYDSTVVRTYAGLIFENENKEIGNNESIELLSDGVFLENSICQISLENEEFSKENIEQSLYTKWIDYDKIDKMVLRHRQSGDYLVVNDQGSRKKLKDYFINEKIPSNIRDQIWVVADGNHIVWVIGYRISSYYKVTEDTKNVLRIEYKEK